jgi:hypothetical protein
LQDRKAVTGERTSERLKRKSTWYNVSTMREANCTKWLQTSMEALTLADIDINENWERYKERYLRRIKR